MLNQIAAGTLAVCASCGKTHRYPVTVVQGMLPIRVTCPHCQVAATLTTIPILPKVAPTTTTPPVCQLSSVEVVDAVERVANGNSTESADAEPEPAQPAEMATFQTKAVAIGNQLEGLLSLTLDMRTSIAEFEKAMQAYFVEQLNISNSFKVNFEPAYLEEFILSPFTAGEVACESKEIGQYTRIILSPKFYAPRVGIHLTDIGGMRAELLTPFTRLYRPLTDVQCGYYGVPRNIALELHGTKITGGDMQFIYQSIPGVTEDDDHTAEWPSIRVDSDLICRAWLARHGVRPWMKRQLTKEDVFELTLNGSTTNDIYRAAYDRFIDCGRLTVFWPSLNGCREFAFLASHMVKGLKAIYTDTEESGNQWRPFIGPDVLGKRSYIYINNHTQTSADILNREVQCIIVDLDNLPNASRLEWLYDYHGKLLMVGRDPLLDTLRTAEQAELVYGLAADVDYRYSEDPVPHLNSRSVAPEVLRALIKLRA